jgi:bacteriocin-like protein
MNRQSEIADAITTKLAPAELSQEELDNISGGAQVDYFDKASPKLYSRSGPGTGGVLTEI